MFSCSVMSNSLQPHGLQHTSFPVLRCLPEFAQTHVHWVSDPIQPSYPLWSPFPPAWWSFPTSGSFQMSHLFASGGQSIGASASASVLPMNIQGWFCWGLTGLISLQSKGLSRVFSSTRIQKHQFLGPSLLYGSSLTSICDFWKNHSFNYMDLCWQWSLLCVAWLLRTLCLHST